MGQRNSSARYCNGQDGVPRAITPSRSIRRSLRRKMGPKHVSTTFNLIHSSLDTSPLDVNLATVDDLSRLPGITPTLAARIVRHRQTLGSFSQTEDVALVNGVGAEKLHRIRPHICLGGHDIRYYGNSSPPSPDSISSCHQGLHKININTATIFDLLQVQCLSQELADNIIHYRTKHGDFRSLSQLSRVRGISRRTAKALVHFLTLDDASEVDSGSERTSVTAPVLLPSRRVGGPWGHRRTQSGPITLHEPYVPSFVDVCELLAVHTPRPASDRRLVSQRHGRPVVRLATWNLERLCADKIANPGVLEVICRTLLENNLAIVAVQDIIDVDALKKICNELNNPTLHRVNNWRGVRGCWHYVMSSSSTNQQPTGSAASTNGQLGFLYDMSRSVRFEGSGPQAVCRHQGEPFVTSFVGRFKVNDSPVSVVTVRLRQATSDPPSGGESGNCWCAIRPLDAALRGALKQQQTVVVAGDFGLSSNQSEFDVLRDLKFHPILPGDVTTAAGETATGNPPSGNPHPRHFSNIWITEFSKLAYTGTCEVVDSGLSHLAIPHGWRWGGLVSSHAPLFCELYATPAPGSSASDRLAALQAEYRRHEELFRLEFEQMALASTPEFAVPPPEALVAVDGSTSAIVQRHMKTLCAA